MAKSKVSEKGTKKQEDIKELLDTVSYDLFDELYGEFGVFLDRVNLLTKLGMSYGDFEGVMDVICYIAEHETKRIESFFDRAISERRQTS